MAEAGAARIDLDDQTVDSAAGVVRFEIDEQVKHRLFHGLDDIGATLQNAAAIDAFEAAGHADRGAEHDGAVSAEADAGAYAGSERRGSGGWESVLDERAPLVAPGARSGARSSTGSRSSSSSARPRSSGSRPTSARGCSSPGGR